MKKKERIIWIFLVLFLLIITTASGLNNWIFAGDAEKNYKQLRILNEVYNLLRTEYYDSSKVTPDVLVEGAINGMIKTLEDPHTSYLPEELYNELQTDTRGEFGGLGIVIGVRDKWITVISPIDDTPAHKVGIKAGDRIIEIEGKSTEGFTTMDAVKFLRGKVGTSVTITIKREGVTEPLKFTIIRGLIKLETVKSSLIDGHIGYFRISQFSENTAETLRNHLQNLKNEGMDSIIVDLRNNPGGLLPSVIEITDMFLSEGVIVSTRGRDPSQNQVFRATEKVLLSNIPLIVLINEGSASASEIFAGAIKDNQRGILVGGKTYGKGSVQTVRELPNGAGVRITTALYYTPSGKSIDHIGIEPDEIVHGVEITDEELKGIEKVNELGLIEEFTKNHPDYTEKDVDELLKKLRAQNINLRSIIVKRMIKNELEKYSIPELVDLEYDLQLKHAVNMLNSINLLLKQKAS